MLQQFRLNIHYNYLTDISGLSSAFQSYNLTHFGNPISDQKELNDILLPITYYGKSIVNTYKFQLKDIEYPNTQEFYNLQDEGLYPAIGDNGFCFSSYKQAKFYQETQIQNQTVKNCQNCFSPNCHSCINENVCEKCRYSKISRILEQNCNCPKKFYDGNNYSCIKCMYKCATCMNNTTCIDCVASNPPRTTNQCICPDNYYDDGENHQCQKCMTNCLKCNNFSTCQVCKERFFVNEKQQCQICKFPCITCTESKDFCLSCKKTYQLVDNKCQKLQIEVCPQPGSKKEQELDKDHVCRKKQKNFRFYDIGSL